MPAKRNIIAVFEHDRLIVGHIYSGIEFQRHHLDSLEKYLGIKGTCFFSLIHNGVKFCEYVGVLQVGNLTIEVLPKADKSEDTDSWRNKLIEILHKVGIFRIASTSRADLKLRSNHLLDLYFAEFIKEVEFLVHVGLIKKYRKTEDNVTTLKGSLYFPKHITKNLVHQEMFYTRHTIYDRENSFNKVLYKTILLIERLNVNAALSSRIGTLLLDFPEMPDINVSEIWFKKLSFSRRTEYYRKAVEISRLLLLNFHPDLSHGRDHVLALMFDMNLLWEKFVYVSLRRYFEADSVLPQQRKPYWILKNNRPVGLKPDILIRNKEHTFIIDTKWKVLDYPKPSEDDLRQMYAYTKYFHADHTLICYPGSDVYIEGNFLDETVLTEKYKCSIRTIGIDVKQPIENWQKKICQSICASLNMNLG